MRIRAERRGALDRAKAGRFLHIVLHEPERFVGDACKGSKRIVGLEAFGLRGSAFDIRHCVANRGDEVLCIHWRGTRRGELRKVLATHCVRNFIAQWVELRSKGWVVQ